MHTHRVIRRAQKDDPMFLRRVFVAHYLGTPYHIISDSTLYPKTLIEDLFAASVYLMRSFELSPFRSDDLEDKIINDINNGKL